MRISINLDTSRATLGYSTQEVATLHEKRATMAVLEVQFYRGVTVVELANDATGKFELKLPTKYDMEPLTGASAWTKFGTGTDTYYRFAYALINTPLDTSFGVQAEQTYTTTFAADTFAATAHGYVANDIVQFSSTLTLSAPLKAGTDYYISATGLTANVFEVSATLGGSVVNLTNDGTGTQSVVKISDDVASLTLMGEVSWRFNSQDYKTQTISFVIENDVNRDADTIPVSPAIVYTRDSFIRHGAGVPSDAVGVDGDAYVNDTTGDLYFRAAGVYTLDFNLNGQDSGFLYQFNTATTLGPGTGKFLFNHATFGSATAFHISETDGDANSLAAFLALQDDSTSTNKCLVIARKQDGTPYFSFYITAALTDAGVYDTFPITPISTAGSIANNDYFRLTFLRVGDLGTTGSTGSTGATGTAGATPAITQAYSTTTTDADPGAGVFRFNNATIASVTAAYIDNVEAGAASITAYLDTFDDSLSTVKGVLVFRGVTTSTAFAVFQVTGSVVDGTGYRKLTLAYIASGGTWTTAHIFAFSFHRTGDLDSTSPINAQPNDYTFVLADAGKTIYHAHATPHTYTIPANGSVAYGTGTLITILNANGSGDITLAITTDTLRKGSGTAGTGSRTIPADSIAFIEKATSTVWYVGGYYS